VVTAAPAAAIGTAGGQARDVTTVDGQRITARRAVVSSAHLAVLAGMLEEPPADLVAARDSWRPGLSVFAVHAALKADLSYPGGTRSVAAGYGTVAGIADQLDGFWRDEPDTRDPWLLVVDQTVVDPDRAPDGAATFKILTIAPHERADGRPWAEAKDEHAEALIKRVGVHAGGLSTEDILAVRAESPVDVAAHNPFNLGGSCHGGEFVLPSGEVIPGWTSYGTGVPGLFLTGATSHPGGSVSGRPGRSTARALQIDPAAVMGPR
jgi:phytoene dehydrogenase-like protein